MNYFVIKLSKLIKADLESLKQNLFTAVWDLMPFETPTIVPV